MTNRTQLPHGRTHQRRMLLAMLLVLAASGRGGAQVPVVSPFEMIGFIQSATLNDPTDVFSGGTITLNNHVVVVPRNSILQMPATSLTWAEVFKFAPSPYGPTQSGLALADNPKPFTTYEVFVQGNRVQDTYIAGLLFLSQHSLQIHQGAINFIDYSAGELRVNGTPGDPATGARVRLNDPIGRFGRKMSPDPRFSIDENNPTVRSETGYPMCLPRTDPAVADDAACPQKNRPKDPATGLFRTIFTMPPPSAATWLPDATVMAPFEIGDYITYSGNLMPDGYIAAWSISANVGIFTAPGTQPAYVAIDVIVMGTGPTNIVGLAQEGARRTIVEGFTTDSTQPVDIFAVDVDPCTGEPTDRYWGSRSIDPGVPNGAVKGRWRFRPGAPLFNLKGLPFLPPTREVHVISMGGIGKTLANGLTPGQYQAPNFEFILPENLGIGNPPVPANLGEMRFLAQGSGPWFGGGSGSFATAHPQGIAGQITPFPYQVPPQQANCGAATVLAPIAIAGPNQTVDSRAAVTLDASGSSDRNATPLPLTFLWKQITGPAVALTDADTTKATFTAPKVAFGGVAEPLQFLLTVDNDTFASTAMITVIVNPATAPDPPPVVDPPVVSEPPVVVTDPITPPVVTSTVTPTAVAPPPATVTVAPPPAPAPVSTAPPIAGGVTAPAPKPAPPVVTPPPTPPVVPKPAPAAVAAPPAATGAAATPAPATAVFLPLLVAPTGVQAPTSVATTPGSTPTVVTTAPPVAPPPPVAPAQPAAGSGLGLPPIDPGTVAPTTTTNPDPVTPPPPVILPPTATAGPDQTVTSGTTVTVSGVGSDLNTPARPLILTLTQAAGAPAVVLTPTSVAGVSPATAIFTAPTLAVGAKPIVLTFTLTVDNGATPAVTSNLTVTVNPPAATGPVVDKTVFSDGVGARTTAPFSTKSAGEVLVAFAASDGPTAANAQTLTISGAGLTWTRVQRAATQLGTAEIWTATAATVLTNVTVTSLQSAAGFHQSLTVVAFTGVSAIGASNANGGAKGAPTESMAAQAAGSVVYGVGSDTTGAVARTLPAGQTMVHEFVDTAVGATFWVQAVDLPTASVGATVTLNATAPTKNPWNLAIVELKR